MWVDVYHGIISSICWTVFLALELLSLRVILIGPLLSAIHVTDGAHIIMHTQFSNVLLADWLPELDCLMALCGASDDMFLALPLPSRSALMKTN